MTILRPLTLEERAEINHVISQKMNEDDRDPHMIIEEDYDGDMDLYLRTMAELHHIPVGIKRFFLEKIKPIIGYPILEKCYISKLVVGLPKEEIDILVIELRELRKEAEKKVVDDISEIIDTALSDSMFSPGGMSSGMGDFYDNNVSSAQVGANQTYSEIDRAIKIFTEISNDFV